MNNQVYVIRLFYNNKFQGYLGKENDINALPVISKYEAKLFHPSDLDNALKIAKELKKCWNNNYSHITAQVTVWMIEEHTLSYVF